MFKKNKLLFDVSLIIILFLTGWFLGYTALHNHGQPRNFFSLYHAKLSAAVMFACGKGYQYPDASTSPALTKFLVLEAENRSDRFDCHDIPPKMPLFPSDGMQNMQLYLFGIAALWWKITGTVSWSGLYPLYGLMHGITVVTAYGIGRLLFSRAVSLLFAGSVMLTPGIYWMVMQVRDYAKIPFIFLTVLLLGLMIKTTSSRHRLLWLAALQGLVFGIGIGFRIDLLVLMPLVMVTLFFLVDGSWREQWRHRLLATVVMLSVMGLSGAPILYSLFQEGDPSPTMFMGFQNGFSRYMGVRHSLYEIGYQYHDMYLYTQIQEHADRLYHEDISLYNPTTQSEVDMYLEKPARAAQRQIHEVIAYFPADLLVRGLSALKAILNLVWPANIGVILAGTAGLLLAANHLRAGILLALMLLIVGGYPAILFKPRHYSHLILLQFWVSALFLQIGVQFLLRNFIFRSKNGINLFFQEIFAAPHWPQTWNGVGKRLLLFVLIVGLPLLGLLHGLRFYQESRVIPFLERVTSLSKEPLPLKETLLSDDKILIQGEGFPNVTNLRDTAQSDYLLAIFNRSTCGLNEVDVAFRYEKQKRRAHNFDRETTVVIPKQGDLAIYYPVYRSTSFYFKGVEMMTAQRSCLTGLYRVVGFESLPLLLTLTLPQDWRSYPMYHSLTWETPPIEHSPFLIRNHSYGMPDHDMGL
ncbi:MAG: glycosyltransferase family 39 protein [Magnetococcus sp. DMHC-6]